MQTTYDKEADAMSITLLPDAERASTTRVALGILAHFDRDRHLIEVEILGASGQYPPAVLEQLGSPAELLTLADAAKRFGLARTTLRNQILNKKIPATKSGRDWVVTCADMLTYMDNRAPSGRPARKKKARRVIDLMGELKKSLASGAESPAHPAKKRARRGRVAS